MYIPYEWLFPIRIIGFLKKIDQNLVIALDFFGDLDWLNDFSIFNLHWGNFLDFILFFNCFSYFGMKCSSFNLLLLLVFTLLLLEIY